MPGAGWINRLVARATDAVPLVCDDDDGPASASTGLPLLRSSIEVTDEELLAELTGDTHR